MIKRVSKITIIFHIILLIFNCNIYGEELPHNTSDAAIVMEQKTGRILYSKNIDDKKPMASTTKIMTGILAIENGNKDDLVKVSKTAACTEGSSIWLEENEILTLEELIYGLMLKSGNDAAYAIGEHIGGGDMEKFVQMMNEKAKNIKANNTSFANPHGLHDDNHYTTAYDLAKIASYGMGNVNFRKIVSTKTKKISWVNSKWDRILNNTNKMLLNYEGCNGVKTGYTSKAGRCLVSSALRNGMQLISVVLRSNDIWSDSKKILDYSFDTYKPFQVFKKGEYIRSVHIINGNKKFLNTYCEDSIILPIKDEEKEDILIKSTIPDKLNAPIEKDQILGNIEIFIGNEKVSETKVLASDKIEEKTPNIIFRKFLKEIINN